ncbi:MAG: hypothetical protein U0802_20550 [Candidatus Binatia bacterium]
MTFALGLRQVAHAEPHARRRHVAIISALLILALGFAGYWIIQYAQTGGPPHELLPWFGWLPPSSSSA